MVLLVTACLVIILLSFIASSMEAALFTVTPLQIEKMCTQNLPGAHRLKTNKETIHDSIIAIVILNNLANIAGSIFVGAIAADTFSDAWLGVFSGVLTFAIILAGEVMPKMVGERYANTYARLTATPVHVLRLAFLPFVALLKAFAKPLGKATESRHRTSEEEITLLAGLGHEHGAIEPEEHQLIKQVFQLNDILAKDIMTPRTVVFALPADEILRDAAPKLYTASVSRIPLYGSDLDDIHGIVHIRDVLAALAKGQGEKPLKDFAEEVPFVPDTARADILLRTFQRNREHLAVVIDEYGGMAGVITLEDILEQLVGEIVDEHDRDVDMRARARVLRERKERT